MSSLNTAAARIALLAPLAAVAVVLAACGRQDAPPAPKAEPAKAAEAPAPKAAEPLKVGFVYVSPVGDAGWTTQHNAARLALEQALGDKV